jgi:hypothetical protein
MIGWESYSLNALNSTQLRVGGRARARVWFPPEEAHGEVGSRLRQELWGNRQKFASPS